ncbi:MAG: STAS domain-containing protein [Phycisphaerales bacterium]|nr:STAS domain-containing protein [Phycisphaerales bacterium]
MRDPHHATSPEDLPQGSRRGSLADIEFIGETAVATLTVTELSSGAGADQLATLLHELAETGARHFILDVQNVQHMDSGCLGVLVEATGQLAKHGGRIALVNADRGVSYLFKLTRLDRIFPICRDVMSALAAVERTGNGADASDAA